MKRFYILFLIGLSFLLFSCSKDKIKESVVNEKSLDLQVKEAYEEGMKSLESQEMYYLLQKNLMKQKFYSLNQIGHLSQH